MAKKLAAHMIDRIFSGEDPMSVVGFFQIFKWACDVCRIREDAAIWLFKQSLTGPADAVAKTQV